MVSHLPGAVIAFAGKLEHHAVRLETVPGGAPAQRRKSVGRVEFGDRAAIIAQQKRRRRALMGMGTGDIGIAALDLVDETMRHQEIERPIDGDRRRPRPVIGHPLDHLIGADRGMAPRHGGQHVAALLGQSCAAARAQFLGTRQEFIGAMGVIMFGRLERHYVIL